MSEPAALVLPAVHSAVEELRRRRVRFEVFARAGESLQLRRHSDGSWERRRSREVGVACRVAGGGSAGFAASSGSSARAGREAARAALGAMLPGPDPLPPRELLGCLAVPLPPPPVTGEELEAQARAFAAALSAWGDRLRLLDLRAVEGVSSSLLTTGEGFSCSTAAGGGVVEALLAPARGPLRLVHWAARTVRELQPERLARPVGDAVLTLSHGHPARRQLADVVLAPAAAARLIAAIARAAATPAATGAAAAGARRRGAAGWHLVDERIGAHALLPLPCDGEGFPVRRLDVIAGGALVGGWSTWAQAGAAGRPPGGSVRPSYQDEPRAGPANLVVESDHRQSRETLLRRLGGGFLLDFPDGDARVDGGAVSLRAGALAIAGGAAAAAHPVVELRGSLRRLLAGLDGVGDDDATFSFDCTVTAPSLLLRGLEIA
jgi:predicted Zn-dependent protease